MKNDTALRAVGEYVIYRGEGISRISDIRSEDFYRNGQRKYYVLNSVYDNNSVTYVPLDAPDLCAEMRDVLSADEVEGAISCAKDEDVSWIDDSRERETEFTSILKSGNRAKMLEMIKLISIRKDSYAASKKNLHVADEKFLATAKKVISEEFAFVLGIDRDAVIPYIMNA